EWHQPDEKAIVDTLVKEHDFNIDRVKNGIERLLKAYRDHIKGEQKGLAKWFSKTR
ncbi:MAG: flap structure-specific endonuclease, partial [Desulfurococcaceae archaeon]